MKQASLKKTDTTRSYSYEVSKVFNFLEIGVAWLLRGLEEGKR